MSKKFLLIGIFLLTVLFAVPPVTAQGNRPSPRPTPRMSPRPTPALNESRLRVCQSREAGITTRMGSLVRMSENMVGVFDSIAERVKTFYTEKVLPTGKTVPNYDALVAEIAAKKAVVDSDLTATQTKVDDFSCEEGDPRGLYSEFRLGMQKVKSDLKAYRTAIKNLIVAVRGKAPKESPAPSATPVMTATPTATPTASP